MDVKTVLTDLRAELNGLTEAIAALEALNSTADMPTAPRRGRPTATATQPAPTQRSGRRTMSAAGRKRISEAAKKRWAQQRAQAVAPAKKATAAKKAAPKKTAAKKSSSARHLSPAARKAMSEAAKKRWAERRKAAAKKA